MLENLAELIEDRKTEILDWYEYKLSTVDRCIYSSIDIRFSGKKIAPIDTNLFPAGFNNLNDKDKDIASKSLQEFLRDKFPEANKILLVGEEHTRNLHYLDNLQSIKEIIIKAGYACEIADLGKKESVILDGEKNKNISIKALVKEKDILKTTDDFFPEIIVLNNDLIKGVPEKLSGIKQAILPSLNNGWFKRRKSRHFSVYNNLVQELEIKFDIPKFAISTEIDVCYNVNFKTGDGLLTLAQKAQNLLDKLKKQYNLMKLDEDPYVVIKSDFGSYGMGIIAIKNAEDILRLNQKHKRKMYVTKNNTLNDQVLIQEGIRTIDRVENYIAEPLIYMLNHQIVSFLHRGHQEKGDIDILNSSGMKIFNSGISEKSAYYKCCNFIAMIATLAAALETST